MENQFTFHNYSLSEFYNKILAKNRPTKGYSQRMWNLTEKIAFLNYLKCGFPCAPIIIDGLTCIDGMNRIEVILDLVLGGLQSYFTPKETAYLEKIHINVYISDRPLKELDRAAIRQSFSRGSICANIPVRTIQQFEERLVDADATDATDADAVDNDINQDNLLISNNTVKVISKNKSKDKDIKEIKEIKKITATIKTKIPKKQIHESLKTSVWNKYIGPEKGIAPCWCCKFTTITQREFDTGHVVAEINGGATHIDNLRPICRKCNLSMGAQNMDDFKAKFYGTDGGVDGGLASSTAFKLLL